MSTRKPSELEGQRAARYMRHMDNCHKCTQANPCIVALGHYGRWLRSYCREVLGTCKHLCESECWEDRCRGGKKARA